MSGEIASSSGSEIVLSKSRKMTRRVNCIFGDLDRARAQIGRIDLAPFVQPLLGEEDRGPVDFLSGRASGVPDLEKWIRSKQGNDPLAKGEIEARVAEHVAHVDGDRVEQAGEQLRTLDDPRLELRDLS